MAIWRLLVEGRPRLARGPATEGPAELLDAGATIDGVLGGDPDALAALLDTPAGDPVPDGAQLLAPVGTQPVWAAGVTFLRSRDARLEESRGLDAYDKVYVAERPELFLKALPGTARGPGQPIGVRADSDWDVPEPELALVADRRGQVVGYTVGNDVSSRSIEGENPLYLPQAKLYAGSCALGPCLVPVGEAPEPAAMEIALSIERDRTVLFRDSCSVADMKRSLPELVDWLWRGQDLPLGAVLLTGTSIVPPPDLTLRPGDQVTITITGLGQLTNPVELVDTAPGYQEAKMRAWPPEPAS
ncbi:MAG TPA: fumarylacetoacetate hydrolase family protein [Actinomycetes bacterium]|nr:fumarylacetoacetate hydrolase family protein [Actinomycetes bacterium]